MPADPAVRHTDRVRCRIAVLVSRTGEVQSGRNQNTNAGKWRKSRGLPVDLEKAGLGSRAPAGQARLPPSLSPVSAWGRGTPLRSRPPPPSAAARTRGSAASSRAPWQARWAGCSLTNRRDPRHPDLPAGPGRPASSRLRRGPAIPTTRWWTSWKRPSRCRGGRGSPRPDGGMSSAASSPPRFPPRRLASPRWSARTT